jgi:hypothetical protein
MLQLLERFILCLQRERSADHNVLVIGLQYAGHFDRQACQYSAKVLVDLCELIGVK